MAHPVRARLRGTRLLLGTALAALVLGLLPAAATHASTKPQAAGNDVIANLWSWNWKSVAAECTDVLGPAGYAAVWVAPPAESLSHPRHHWWDVYQPYSYALNGRLGSEGDFTAMTAACNGAGVAVYTDAVVNHTAAQTGTGYAGTAIGDKYAPPMYSRADYNVDVCNREIADWNDKWEVQNCELLGLPDLKTGSDSVRDRIAGYLNSQIARGVSGFRVDAAKHIPAADLEAIVGRLDDTAAGSPPFVFHEVFPGGTPAPDEYYGSGRVLDFFIGDRLKAAFHSDIAQLENLGDQGLLPARNSVSFVTNHDTERNGRHLTNKDGDTAVLANVFQLGWTAAPPTVYAGFAYAGNDDSPPADAGGFVTGTDCGAGWYCLDRDPRITGMVGWRNAVGDAAVTDWQSPRGNVVGFGRGDRGFVALNNTGGAVSQEFGTAVADGVYCNALDGCATKVTVAGGRVALDLPAKGAVAFHP
ncbi:alpha-amylase [Streptomyces sp. 184]|uniref:alpha-amylase n=1 Tax=Streptomyces sp. 184 TaxID=1827526 RepID=UPI0038918914